MKSLGTVDTLFSAKDWWDFEILSAYENIQETHNFVVEQWFRRHTDQAIYLVRNEDNQVLTLCDRFEEADASAQLVTRQSSYVDDKPVEEVVFHERIWTLDGPLSSYRNNKATHYYFVASATHRFMNWTVYVVYDRNNLVKGWAEDFGQADKLAEELARHKSYASP